LGEDDEAEQAVVIAFVAMKLWVKALTAPRFEIQVNETEKVI